MACTIQRKPKGLYELWLSAESTSSHDLENLNYAKNIISQKVESLCQKSYPTSHSCVNMLNGIADREIVQVIRANGVRAGWDGNMALGEVHICSDTTMDADTAFNTLLHLVNERFKRKSDGKSSKEKPKEYVASDGLPVGTETLRYLKANVKFCQQLEQEYSMFLIFHLTDQVLEVCGPNMKGVKTAIRGIKKVVSNLPHQSLKLTAQEELILKSLNPYHVVREFGAVPMTVGYHLEESMLYLCSDSASNLQKARNIMDFFVKDHVVKSEVEQGRWMSNLMTVRWALSSKPYCIELKLAQLRYMKTMIGEMQAKYNVFIICTENPCTLLVHCTGTDVEKITLSKVQTVVDGLCIKYFMKEDRYIDIFGSLGYSQIVRALIGSQVRAGWSTENGQLLICSADADSVANAERALSRLVLEKQQENDKYKGK